MDRKKILIVDDDDLLRISLKDVLGLEGFDVTDACNVRDALALITSGTYDVLLSDLHMPGAGDGLTLVTAMHHANPNAVTIVLSAFPEMDAAARAIQLQADQILVKPVHVKQLVEIIKDRIQNGAPRVRTVETVATILERTVDSSITDWFALIQTDEKVMSVPLTFRQRTSHLPQLFVELVARLRSDKPIGSKELVSAAAAEHGLDRCRQGYNAAMLVEESRMLQVTIFNTLQKNLAHIDFSILLNEVMTIADEVDSQLSQAMASYSTPTAKAA